MKTLTNIEEKNFNFTCERYNNVAVIGLGYVGLPLCIEFARAFNCVGFDIDIELILILT